MDPRTKGKKVRSAPVEIPLSMSVLSVLKCSVLNQNTFPTFICLTAGY